jgi:hypothetical protein
MPCGTGGNAAPSEDENHSYVPSFGSELLDELTCDDATMEEIVLEDERGDGTELTDDRTDDAVVDERMLERSDENCREDCAPCTE